MQAVHLVPEWRGKGLASALISRSTVALREYGITEVALTADTENPSGAPKLYEKMGFRVHAMYGVYRKPLHL